MGGWSDHHLRPSWDDPPNLPTTGHCDSHPLPFCWKYVGGNFSCTLFIRLNNITWLVLVVGPIWNNITQGLKQLEVWVFPGLPNTLCPNTSWGERPLGGYVCTSWAWEGMTGGFWKTRVYKAEQKPDGGFNPFEKIWTSNCIMSAGIGMTK